MENQMNETQVLMHTSMGDIQLKLYNETPKHRDNFIQLVKDGTYNGLLFHRVIKDFMIQGGDVTSKNAPMNKSLGAENSIIRNTSIRKVLCVLPVPAMK